MRPASEINATAAQRLKCASVARRLLLGDVQAPAWPLLLLYALAQLYVNGYQFAAEDLSLYIPYAPHYYDASLFNPNDYFMILFSRTYTLFWIALYPFTRLLGWEWTLFLLFLSVKLFTTWAIWTLARFLTGDARAAWLALLLLLVNRMSGGTMTSIFENYPTTRVVALPFALLALRHVGERRMIAAAVLFGVCWNIHIFTALMYMIIGALMILYNFRELILEQDAPAAPPARRSPPARNLLIPAAIFFAFALPLLIWRWMIPPLPVENFSDAQWQQIHRIRTPYCFLSTWTARQWHQPGALLMLALLSLGRFAAAGRLRLVTPALAAIGLMVLIQYAGSEVLVSQPLYQLQLTRALQFLDLLAMFGAAALIAHRVRGRHGWCAALFGAILLAGVLCWNINWMIFSFGVYLMILLAVDPERHGFAPWIAALLLLFLLLQFCVQPNWGEGVLWPRGWLLFVLIAAALLYCGLRVRHWAAGCALPLLLIVSWHWIMPPAGQLRKNPFNVPAATLHWPGRGMNNLWYDVQLWARDNTPADAVFFTPPYFRGFRMFSLRSCFVEWKDGAPGTFDRAYAQGWVEHMQALGIWPPLSSEQLIETHHERSAGEWRRLAAQYGVDYLITERECDYPFEIALRRGNVVIWRLR